MSRLLPDIEGRSLLVADLIGTVAMFVVLILLAVSNADAITILNLIVSGALFIGGCIGFGIGFFRAVGRSRTEQIDMAGLFYLTDSAPKETQRVFMGLWFAQIAIAAVSIAVSRPFPFEVMAPLWGIGIIAWWASSYATFPPRDDSSHG
ncbi:hypothetical protein [Aquihabitans sp. McL0605]|uniref:hypothetical protein n=1 Tax=Aquihabitans sp. McL0605 TaxID=3415671 RepID=UPI003CF0D7FE